MKTIMMVLAFLLTGCGCSAQHSNNRSGDTPDPKTISWVVQARSTVTIQVGGEEGLTTWTSTGNDTTEVVNLTMSPNVSMVVSTAGFISPVMTNALLSFGNLNVTALTDNSLLACGPSNNQKCTAAAIRVYTTGESGNGFWNAAAGYGAPLNVTIGTAAYQATGVGVANALYLSNYTISPSTNVVYLSNFTPAPKVLVQGDFTNAGAGSYATTLNIEFVVGM